MLYLGVKINSGSRTPETVNVAIAHYKRIESVPESKSHATLENVAGVLRLHIVPTWGMKRVARF